MKAQTFPPMNSFHQFKLKLFMSVSSRIQLDELMTMQQRLYNDSAAYTDLQNNLKLIVSNELKSLKTKVNIGSDVYQEVIM